MKEKNNKAVLTTIYCAIGALTAVCMLLLFKKGK